MAGRLEPIWHGRTAVCIASGPSLTLEQCEIVRQWRERDGCRVIVVNDAYLLAPWADAMYFADVRWWQWQTEGVDRPVLGLKAREVRERFKAFSGLRISIENGSGSVADPGVIVLRNLSVQNGTMGKLSTDPTGIYTGQNSGYQAIDAANLLGAKRIALLGYDMKVGGSGQHHWFGDHPHRQVPTIYQQWRAEFKRLAENLPMYGIEIVNVTADSELEAFPRMTLASLVAYQSAAPLPA